MESQDTLPWGTPSHSLTMVDPRMPEYLWNPRILCHVGTASYSMTMVDP